MVADPCGAALLPGIYGTSEGIMSKVKSSFFDGSQGACGYVLWNPDWHNGGTDSNAQFANLFTWVHDDSSSRPLNTDLAPYGTGTRFDVNSPTAYGDRDPAYNFVNENLVQDARTISACIDLTYFGAMYEAEGEITFINNLPATAIVDVGEVSSASVDELFQWSGNAQRLGVDTLTNKWRPTAEDVFYDNEANFVNLGTPGTSGSFLDPVAVTRGPHLFGFAFRGLSTDQTNKLRYNLSKIVEWRAKPSSGLAQTNVKATGVSTMGKVLKDLDATFPGWQHEAKTQVYNGATNVAAYLAKLAMTGATSMIAR